jgi:NTP pyrophosphatase (non-canonical NTP hydrolase)
MQFNEIKDLALQVRSKYEKLETKRNGKPWSNEQIMEGFMVDVGDLTRLVMAKEGIRDAENIDERLAHELTDCLWGVIVLAEKYNIDLEETFVSNMKNLEERLNNK